MKTQARKLVKRWILLVPLALCSCSTIDPVTGQKVNNYYSLQEEVKLGREVVQANTAQLQKAGVPVDADKRELAKLNRIMNDIAVVSHLPDLPYNITLYHTNIVNAAAAPGGSMFVFEGLWDPEKGLVANDDELAAVMAHEIAHVNCRHVTERMTKVMPVNILATIGAIWLEMEGESEWAAALGLVSVAGLALWLPSYTRNDEREADRVGMFYMAKAGYDPRAAVRIWSRATQKKGGKKGTGFFDSHPSNKDRFKALAELLPDAMEEYKLKTGRYPDGYDPADPLAGL